MECQGPLARKWLAPQEVAGLLAGSRRQESRYTSAQVPLVVACLNLPSSLQARSSSLPPEMVTEAPW